MKLLSGNAMQWHIVNSTHIQAAAYDAEKQEMFVRFANGHVYKYNGVPESEFEGLITTSSVGTYMHDNIRGQYTHERV